MESVHDSYDEKARFIIDCMIDGQIFELIEPNFKMPCSVEELLNMYKAADESIKNSPSLASIERKRSQVIIRSCIDIVRCTYLPLNAQRRYSEFEGETYILSVDEEYKRAKEVYDSLMQLI
ncbi:hypothetical protein A165_17115 [Vibrio tasmaniensis ZS-17]|uniref:hypothetical protein n=1 Tax=Vibrio tasmaniensis TaxID=212663 RepID=UPI00035EEDC2|nr:hypothetical protein [Vibrio tasmaniensis]OED61194.1 hypothetical protein A165_17115 [Vibrio tasmaniensis ZS-17]